MEGAVKQYRERLEAEALPTPDTEGSKFIGYFSG